jgi:hypothetical protein
MKLILATLASLLLVIMMMESGVQAADRGCHKGYCWKYCTEKLHKNQAWCYTNKSGVNDYAKCSSDNDCVNANDCYGRCGVI